MTLIKVYRIEHKDSKLGPFHHKDPDGVSQRVLDWGLKYDGDVFKDIDDCSRVRVAYANKAITGFSRLSDLLATVRSPVTCHKHGFVIKAITLQDDACILRHNQVVFCRNAIQEEKEYSFLNFDDFAMEYIDEAYTTET